MKTADRITLDLIPQRCLYILTVKDQDHRMINCQNSLCVPFLDGMISTNATDCCNKLHFVRHTRRLGQYFVCFFYCIFFGACNSLTLLLGHQEGVRSISRKYNSNNLQRMSWKPGNCSLC